MIIVDTPVWVHHFRKSNEELGELLDDGDIMIHPFVIGELALGQLRNRAEIISLMEKLPQAPTLTQNDLLTLIENHKLWGSGIGWVDLNILGSSLITDTLVWTLDKSLMRTCQKLDCCFE